MEQRRPGLGTDRLQDALQLRLVVAVDEAEIMESHILKERGVIHGPAHHFFAVYPMCSEVNPYAPEME